MKTPAYGIAVTLLLLASQGIARNSQAGHPGMAPISQYLMPRAAEVSLARSAAPESIS